MAALAHFPHIPLRRRQRCPICRHVFLGDLRKRQRYCLPECLRTATLRTFAAKRRGPPRVHRCERLGCPVTWTGGRTDKAFCSDACRAWSGRSLRKLLRSGQPHRKACSLDAIAAT